MQTAEQKKTYRRDWYRQRRKDPEFLAKESEYKRLRKYGITKEEYDSRLAKPNFKCAVCLLEVPPTEWKVDHCHTTGKVRGLLCNHCNLMLGHSRDNTDTLRRAIDYLKAV